MKIRQYERGDCNEAASMDMVYEISRAGITANNGGDVDRVAVFGNPQTRKVVWVPYGSIVQVQNQIFKIKRGELKKDIGERCHYGDLHDQSVECLSDFEGRLHSMEDLEGQMAIPRFLNNNLASRISHFTFDLTKNKIQNDKSGLKKWRKYVELFG
jgi:hypothetical protein